LVEKAKKWLFLAKEADFASGAVGTEVIGEVKGGAGAGGDGGIGSKSTESEEAGGFVEAEASAELTGGGAQGTATKRGVEGAETVEFD
jgi:hypothetical protein